MILTGFKGAKMAKKVDLKTVAPAALKQPTTAEEVRQEISNICVQIGDKQYGIRQFERDIENFYAEIDGLRNKLFQLEKASGSKDTK
jgi:uncharacterized coiled-coil DUF342 family protein